MKVLNLQGGSFVSTPSVVMAVQTVISKGIDRELLKDLAKCKATLGPDSQSAKEYEALLRAKSQEVLDKAKDEIAKVDSGQVALSPLTLDEVTEMWIASGGNNKTIGEYRARKVVQLASMPEGCSEDDLTTALGIEGDEFSKLMGKLMGKGLIRFENNRYFAA